MSLVNSAAVVVNGRLPIYNILLIVLAFPFWQCTQIEPDAQVIFRAEVTGCGSMATCGTLDVFPSHGWSWHGKQSLFHPHRHFGLHRISDRVRIGTRPRDVTKSF